MRAYQQAIIITVISVAPYLTDKIEHTVLYKINENNNYMVITLYKFFAHHTVTEQFWKCSTSRLTLVTAEKNQLCSLAVTHLLAAGHSESLRHGVPGAYHAGLAPAGQVLAAGLP